MLARTPNPRDLVSELVKGNPGRSREDIFGLFQSSLDEQSRRAVEWFFFINMYDAIRLPKPKQNAQVVGRIDVDRVKRQVAAVVFMNLVLPSGIRLADATFADCADAGGWFVSVAALSKQHQVVGQTLTEQQLRELPRLAFTVE